MSHFGIPVHDMERQGAKWTAHEIAQQPEVWAKIQSMVATQRSVINLFLAPLIAQPGVRIILTGAGTSAFIGQCLAPALLQKLQRRVEAIATTDLVSSPDATLQPGVPTLLISFARSGNSPESIAAIELSDRLVPNCSHLIFTCNATGALHQRMHLRPNSHVFLLPEETNDCAFAMTSSFSGMLLAAMQVFNLVEFTVAKTAAIGAAAIKFMSHSERIFTTLSHPTRPFDRVVYLGSNGLKGLAREAALKLLELTDGKIMATADSPLGFRHGPKTMINDSTLIVFFLSNNSYTRQYDLDLLRELRREKRAARIVALSSVAEDLPAHSDNIIFALPQSVHDLEQMPPFIVFAQLFALLSSLRLGITPDNPSASGTVTRVVTGVIIHPMQGEALDVSGR